MQALHPFYRKTGEVVASWMTRLDRDRAIEDNLAYVGSVVAAICEQKACSGVLAFAGFSQGVAMAYRAAAASSRKASALIVLAGDVPPEIQGAAAERLPPVLLGRGTEDSWYSDAKMQADLERLEQAGVPGDDLRLRGWPRLDRRVSVRRGQAPRPRGGGGVGKAGNRLPTPIPVLSTS